PIPDLVLTAPEPDPKPTPARGFDAVAEAVLGDDPVVTAGEGVAFLAEPMARINEAVKAGRIEEAAGLAERTVDEAAGALGPDHLEVLRLRELTAYIAYLAGDPVRSFHLSLDLAHIRHRAHDAEGAYGSVQSAATAWRAVRDPGQGLSLGRALLDLWTELATEDGPAVEDIEQLESARARMGRLTERARRATD
ncbi:tetratricopeptide repeat protein, partial [Streptomyces sp. MBT62]|nr:tetratricopeptide repeat protein [Streptomyces sp. MBT62]